ncbi:MCP four helix bundle domain-containing protein [Pseudopedobacter saltans]|uniref:MCP four helix bundle domain-containing protein n=1 Tax=Pseudopedobacter saltans TaxID=151895 RepID=UPI0011D18B00|nr:MCP four helix bundle domain-containing protein [Pseudopedobacter saltans]
MALVLFLLMAGIIVSNIFEKKILEKSKKATESIYLDRLQPSTYLFQMRQLIADRVFLLERKENDSAYSVYSFKKDLQEIDNKLSILLEKYEKTYIVSEEEVFLKKLKRDIGILEEKSGYNLQQQEELKPKIDAINDDLGELIKIQSKIGEETLAEHAKITSISNILNVVQLILATLIGVFIFALFSKKKSSLNKIDKHRLN